MLSVMVARKLKATKEFLERAGFGLSFARFRFALYYRFLY